MCCVLYVSCYVLFFMKLLQLKLKILAKIILAKYKPEIIGVTGSLGKTSARDAIASVLSSRFCIGKSIKNYNNEIGMPLTIIGVQFSGGFILGWSKVFLKALKLILIHDKSYPKILILEMGIDRIGDMDYLLSIAKPKIGVVTNISESHLEFLKTVENIAEEKGKLVQSLGELGWAVLNYNDKRVLEMKKLNKKVKVLTYGFNSKADIRASDVSLSYDKDGVLNGINFKIIHKDQKSRVSILGVVGYPMVQAALAGVAIGIIYGFNIKEIGQALCQFRVTSSGRANIIPGIKNTLIIDDTYNASPDSTSAAINILNNVKIKNQARRWAVLGDMLELGTYTKSGHEKVGKQIGESKIDKLIVVGERAREIAHASKALSQNNSYTCITSSCHLYLKNPSMYPDTFQNFLKKSDINLCANCKSYFVTEPKMKDENIFHFSSNERAGRFLQERIKDSDIILIKGSRGMKMDEIVEEIKLMTNNE